MLISHDEIIIEEALANESSNLSAAADAATMHFRWEMSAANKKASEDGSRHACSSLAETKG